MVKELDEIGTLAQAVKALNTETITVTVDIVPRNLLDKFLISKGWRPSKREFKVKPVTVRNMYRIAKMAVQIPADYLEGKTVQKVIIEGMADHLEKMIYVVACGLQNDRNEPSASLLDTIKDEFTMQEIAGVFDLIMTQIGVQDFIRSIVLMRGMDILNVKEEKPKPSETSPEEPRETIAHGV